MCAFENRNLIVELRVNEFAGSWFLEWPLFSMLCQLDRVSLSKIPQKRTFEETILHEYYRLVPP